MNSQSLPKVGIVSLCDLAHGEESQGLFRDTESIVWALEGYHPHIFYTHSHLMLIDPKHVIGQIGPEIPGCHIAGDVEYEEWLKTLDVVIFPEFFQHDFVAVNKKYRIPTIFIPNMEMLGWSGSPTGDVEWKLALIRNNKSWITVVAKTQWGYKELVKNRIENVEPIVWSIPDRVITRRKREIGDEVVFLMNAAKEPARTFADRRGSDIAFKAFEKLHLALGDRVKFIFKGIDIIQPIPFSLEGVVVISDYYSKTELDNLRDNVDCEIGPSRWEGMGIWHLEALHRGVPVIVPDSSPLNEYSINDVNAMHFGCEPKGYKSLAEWVEPSISGLFYSMNIIATDKKFRERLTCSIPRLYTDRQTDFIKRIKEIVEVAYGK